MNYVDKCIFCIVRLTLRRGVVPALNQVKARPAASIAGYGRSDPFAKQVNPFLGDSDRVFVSGANSNGNNGVAPRRNLVEQWPCSSTEIGL